MVFTIDRFGGTSEVENSEKDSLFTTILSQNIRTVGINIDMQTILTFRNVVVLTVDPFG